MAADAPSKPLRLPKIVWTDEGYRVQFGDHVSKPFPELAFDYIAEMGSGKVVSDELGDLVKEFPLTDEERSVLRKEIQFKFLKQWQDRMPAVWMGIHPDIFNLYMNYLERWVKHDQILRRVIFLTALSAYSPNPVNLFLGGPSSTGKTYVATQTIKFFPSEDVMLLGSLSPTALVHDYGKYLDEEGNEVEEYDDWHEKNPGKKLKYVVDLQNKILLFLEAPHMETFQRLRPILSHDVYEAEFPFTDRGKKGGMVTKHVFLRGWPATIFCSVDAEYHEELATRSLTTTPEMTEEKYRDAIYMQGEKVSEPWKFQNPDRNLEMFRANVKNISQRIRHFEAVLPFGPELAMCYPHSMPRDMRDFSKLTTLIQQVTYLNLFQRPWLLDTRYKRNIALATLRDFKEASNIFNYIAETTRTGISGNVISFFNEVMDALNKSLPEDIAYEDIVKKWADVYHTTKSRSMIKRQYIDPLLQIGWLDEYSDPDKRNRNLLKVIHGPEENFDEYYTRFINLFKESRLERWVKRVQESFTEARVVIKGEEVDWDEFPYRYFMLWNI